MSSLAIYGYGQDAFFSNILSQSSYDNPTYSSLEKIGDNNNGRITITYRDQWNKISKGAYSSALIEADYSFYQSAVDNWNGGIYFYNDVSNSGVYKINGATLVSNYGRKLVDQRHNKASLFLGAGLGYNNTNINSSNLWFGRQYDQSIFEINTDISSGEPPLVDNLSYFSIDFGARLINEFKNIETEFALATAHLNNPTIGSFDNQESIGTRITGLARIAIEANRSTIHQFQAKFISQVKSLQIVPAYVLKLSVNDYDDYKLQIGTGLRLINNIDGLGAESIIISAGIRTSSWSGAISYDINVSDLNFHTRGGGAFELTLGYLLTSPQ